MKNFNQLLGIGLAILLIWSCSKEQPVLSAPESSELTAEKRIETHHTSMLNSLALGMIDLSKEKTFREMIHTKVSEKFDEDYDVLLRDVNKDYSLLTGLKKSIQSNISKSKITDQNILSDNYQHYLNDELLMEAINGYQVNDEVWYPQVFIPFMDETNLDAIPTIVVGVEDGSEGCLALGYAPQKNGTYKAIEVDEAYAKSHLVWVISINERVNDEGVLYDEIRRQEQEKMDNYRSVAGQRAPDFYGRFKEVKVSTKKECWLCGDAEVSIFWRHIEDDNNCAFDADAYDLRNYVKVKKKKLNKWVKPHFHTGFFANIPVDSNPLDDNESIIWVMYEYDKNHGSLTATFPNVCTGVNRTLNYKSKQSFYGKWGNTTPQSFSGYGSTTHQDDNFSYNSEHVRTTSYDF